MATRARARSNARSTGAATLGRWAVVAIGLGALVAGCGHAQQSEYWGDAPETRTYTLESGLGDWSTGSASWSEGSGVSTAHCPDTGGSLFASSPSSSDGGPSYSSAAVAPRASSSSGGSGHTARRGGPPSRPSVAPSRAVSRSVGPPTSRTTPRLSR